MSQSPEQQIHTIALAGSNGYLGRAVLSALLHSPNPSFTSLTLLVRSLPSVPPSPPPSSKISLKIQQVDFTSLPSLTSALSGIDAFVSTIGHASIASQKLHIAAAKAAGVKRYIPSEFGCDPYSHPTTVGKLRLYAEKKEVVEYLISQCNENENGEGKGEKGMTYSLICCNAFLDWGLDYSFFLDLKNKKVQMYDGGDVQIGVTPTEFVGRGIAGVLGNLGATENRVVRLQGVVTSQRKLWGYAKKILGEEGWSVEEKTSEEMERRAWENLEKNPGDFLGWVWGMIVRALFGEGFSRNYVGENDNELLGLEELTEEEVEGYVRRSVEKGDSRVF